MVKYNPKDWFKLIFQFHKSDTFRQLIWAMLSVALYAWIITYLELHYIHPSKINYAVIYSLLGFVLSLLLVFRTNTAYERWWEGRKAWGSLVNSSRNLALKLSAILPDKSAERELFFVLISNYTHSLRDHLRGKYNHDDLYEFDGFKKEDLISHKHNPNYFALLLHKKINQLHKENKITEAQLIVINKELETFTDVCGICERIKKTPIPYSYSLFIKKFIFIYVMTMPFAFVNEFGYGVVPLITFVFYALVSLELIAEEIEDPFGADANDLPIDDICKNIKKGSADILEIENSKMGI